MFLPFLKGDSVLNNKSFTEYEVQFNLIHRIADDEGAFLLRSEDNKVIIAQSNYSFPMWIWVHPSANSELIGQIINEVKKRFAEQDSFQLIGTPEFMNLFFQKYTCSNEKVMEMESFMCENVLMPRDIPGLLTLPTLEDLEVIADFCVGFIYDGFGKKVTRDSQLEGAKRLINSKNLYVLKVNEEIVNMANIAHRSVRHARINYVYTPPAHRKRGYASKIVAELSSLIIKEGLTPVLFTDLTNSTSNKVYKGIGYTECGKVDHYKIEKTQ